MKKLNVVLFFTLYFSLFTFISHAQNAPKPADPCQKLDTNTIKQLILGTWVDMSDTSHTIYFSQDSLVESIKVNMDGKIKSDISYWAYSFIDNLFSSDAVTCYSLREFKEGYGHHTDVAINSVDSQYLLLGATGKTVFRKK
ncbi:MAG: hypothetical protein ACLQQ4_18165 [Bacteroidia bacterium]